MTPASKMRPIRLQVFVSDACSAEIDRLAAQHGLSRSEAAAQAMVRGLRREIASPDDRLIDLERRLNDHMRLSSRDLRIIEEMLFAQMRILLNRFPESAEDQNPVRRAAIEKRLQRMLDEVAFKIAGGPRAKGTERAAEAVPA